MIVCVYVCVYVCMHVCMHACMYVCMCACMYVFVYVCVCMYVCNACMFAWYALYVCIYVCWLCFACLLVLVSGCWAPHAHTRPGGAWMPCVCVRHRAVRARVSLDVPAWTDLGAGTFGRIRAPETAPCLCNVLHKKNSASVMPFGRATPQCK